MEAIYSISDWVGMSEGGQEMNEEAEEQESLVSAASMNTV